MKTKFIINGIKPNGKGEDIKYIFNKYILTKICYQITGQGLFEIDFRQEKNYGRLAILMTDNEICYITMSGKNPQRGRNSFFQSVPTAYSQFLSDKRKNKKFFVCVVANQSNYLTDYQKFVARLILSCNMNLIDISKNNICKNIKTFNSVLEIIDRRNYLGRRNSSNKSTYITDEGDSYNIYGKTFGANVKETVLLCCALISISNKPIRVFQILDNDSKYIGSNDIKTIYNFAELYGENKFEVLNDSFDLIRNKQIKTDEVLNLRSPKFIYNLLQKTNGVKACAICDCNVSPLIQAAHIYGISEIKNNNEIKLEDKIKMAIDGDNGLWLCMHHHKLYDENLISITKEHIDLNPMNDEYKSFVKHSLTKDCIDKVYITSQTVDYLARHNTKKNKNVE